MPGMSRFRAMPRLVFAMSLAVATMAWLASWPLPVYETSVTAYAAHPPSAAPQMPLVTAHPSASPPDSPSPSPTGDPSPTPTPTPVPTPKPTPELTPKPTARPAPKPATGAARRLRIPALGISKPVGGYGCGFGGDPSGLPSGIYVWGCNSRSNIYLLSHAWSDFAKLRTAYHAGSLRPGMPIWFTGPDGIEREYRLAWAKRVTLAYFNATYRKWATVSIRGGGITMQTCDNPRSAYRIVVRFLPAR
jgi:hypothetical protein